MKECLNASGKTPGIDGVPAEFYKTFWDDLAPSLIASLNYAYKAGTLSVSQRRGVIKLIQSLFKGLLLFSYFVEIIPSKKRNSFRVF